jgi:hypothetical protein
MVVGACAGEIEWGSIPLQNPPINDVSWPIMLTWMSTDGAISRK